MTEYHNTVDSQHLTFSFSTGKAVSWYVWSSVPSIRKNLWNIQNRRWRRGKSNFLRPLYGALFRGSPGTEIQYANHRAMLNPSKSNLLYRLILVVSQEQKVGVITIELWWPPVNLTYFLRGHYTSRLKQHWLLWVTFTASLDICGLCWMCSAHCEIEMILSCVAL